MDAFAPAMADHIAPPDIRQGYSYRNVEEILIAGHGGRTNDGIKGSKDLALNAMVQRKTQLERFPDAPMACQPSGEVFRGDEFVQIDFGDELKTFRIDVWKFN